VSHAFHRAIVEIDVSNLDVRWQAGGVDGKAMILAGDADFTAAQIFDRLITTTVAKL
jgi:hypothetical protein